MFNGATNESVVVPLDEIQVNVRLNYVNKPISILDRKTKTFHYKMVGLVKVQWQHQKSSQWTWEPKEGVKEHYVKLFMAADFKDQL